MQLVHLTPDRIDPADEKYRVSFPDLSGVNEPRNKSDASACDGWMEPLIALQGSGGSAVLVIGFRKYNRWMQSGKTTIPVLLFSTDYIEKNAIRRMDGNRMEYPGGDHSAGWLLALCTVSSVHHTPIEIAGLVRRASAELGWSVKDTMALCPAAWNSSNARALESAAMLPVAVLKRMQNLSVDIGKIALLSRYPAEVRPVAVTLTCGLFRLSVSRMRRMEELVRDIAVRERTSIVRILKKLRREWQARVRDMPDANVAAESFIGELEARRFPAGRQRKNCFRKTVSSLGLDGRVTIEPPPEFEGDFIDVRIRTDSLSNFEDIVRSMISNRAIWNRIFSCVHTDEETFDGHSD